MSAKDLAAQLDGIEYPCKISAEICAQAKASGLVIVFGASDDLMEFRGAINDEVGCCDGGTAYLTRGGLLTNECSNDDCPHFKRQKAGSATIEAMWDDGTGYAWTYKTDIPHEIFIVKEGEDLYCEGIVFALADIP